MAYVYQIAGYVGTGVKRAARNVKAKFTATDAQLLKRAKEGDDSAFNEIVKRYQNFVYKTALSYLHDRENARDITQDVFIKAYKGLPYFNNDSQFTTWLYKICKNQCLNYLRREKAHIEDNDGPTGNYNMDLPLKAGLDKLIAKLKDEYREVIVLRYYQQLKYDEIAHYLDLPMSTVKIRLYRAKQELKGMIGNSRYEM